MNTDKETIKAIINETLYNIYTTHFKSSISKFVKFHDYAINFFEISRYEMYDPPVIDYKIELSNKQANNFIKKYDLKDLVLNYKKYFTQTLENLLLKNSTMTTIYNYIIYYVLLFKSLNEKYNEKIIESIHKYFKNILYTFKTCIIDYKENNKVDNITDEIIFEDLLDIVKNISNDTYKNHILKLYLSLYTLTSPLNNESKNSKFLLDINNNNNIDDYIYLDKNNNIIKFIINKKDNKTLYDIDNQELKDLIFYSYNLYPREYVITSFMNKNKSIEDNQKNKYLKSIHPALTINSIRTSYLNYIVNKNNKVFKDESKYSRQTKINKINKNKKE